MATEIRFDGSFESTGPISHARLPLFAKIRDTHKYVGLAFVVLSTASRQSLSRGCSRYGHASESEVRHVVSKDDRLTTCEYYHRLTYLGRGYNRGSIA